MPLPQLKIKTPVAMAPTTAVQRGRSKNPEGEQLVRWRFAQLHRSGYPDELAAEIAARLDIDLHQATSLTDSRCPPATAARILL
jgi:hypothetical protein